MSVLGTGKGVAKPGQNDEQGLGQRVSAVALCGFSSAIRETMIGGVLVVGERGRGVDEEVHEEVHDTCGGNAAA